MRLFEDIDRSDFLKAKFFVGIIDDIFPLTNEANVQVPFAAPVTAKICIHEAMPFDDDYSAGPPDNAGDLKGYGFYSMPCVNSHALVMNLGGTFYIIKILHLNRV